MVPLDATTGTIAYLVPDDTTGDQIWLAELDGSNERKMYSIGRADPYGVQHIGSMARFAANKAIERLK